MSSPREVFVFGSNLAGIHGAGSALHAKRWYQAQEGRGRGRTGNAYAIPTKDMWLQPMSIQDIEASVHTFMKYAEDNPEQTFKIVAIGCGTAGYRPDQIAPFFASAPDNCELPVEFARVLMSIPLKVASSRD